ncbi:branched-chain amino acid transport system II carrier protein, partial [Bacillus cereus]
SGNVLLSIAIIFACLTTAIGVVSAFANYFATVLTNVSYKKLVKRAKERFKKWAKDMNKILTDFKYVNVLEFQERGAVHFHVVC